MKNKVSISFCILGACVLAYFLGHYLINAHLVYGQTVAKPFRLQQSMTAFKPGSKGVVVEAVTFARRSDGSDVQVRSLVEPRTVLRRVWFMDGRVSSTIDALSAGMNFKQRGEESERRKLRIIAPPPDCVSPGTTQRFVRYDEILGRRAAIVLSEPPRVNHFKITNWRLPEYGCETVKYTSERIGPDGSLTKALEVSPDFFLAGC